MRRLLVFAVLTIAIASCSPGAPEGADITLTEFDLRTAASLESGANTLSIRNDGEFGHTVLISDETGAVVAATGLIGGGETGEIVADLAPGRYEFTCRIVFQRDDGSVNDHYEQGMRSTVTVES